MKLYLSGPMTGVPEYNWPAFFAAADALKARGHEVVNPAELDDPEEVAELERSPNAYGPLYSRFLARDFVILSCETWQVEGTVVLPGWEGSRGACAEVYVTRALDKPVYRMGYPLTKINRHADAVVGLESKAAALARVKGF
jgi:hypothetical protein